MALCEDVLLLEGLIAGAAHMISTLDIDLRESFLVHGHKAASRAVKELRPRLENNVPAQSLNNLHGVLLLFMAAFNCGELTPARLHLQAFKAMVESNDFDGIIFMCLLETARLYDMYVAICIGQCPIMDPQWISSFLASIALIEPTTTPPMNGGVGSWHHEVRVTLATNPNPGRQDYREIVPNGFTDALEGGAISASMTNVVRLYAATRTGLARCFNDSSLDPETLETAHRLNVVCLHGLAFLYVSVHKKLQADGGRSPAVTESLSFAKCFILALQISSLYDQGPAMHFASLEKCHQLRRTLSCLRQPIAVPKECNTESHKERPDHRLRIRTEVVFWAMLVALHHMRAQKVIQTEWMDTQTCRVANALDIGGDDDFAEAMAKYTFSQKEYISPLRAMQNAMVRQNRRRSDGATNDRLEWGDPYHHTG